MRAFSLRQPSWQLFLESQKPSLGVIQYVIPGVENDGCFNSSWIYKELDHSTVEELPKCFAPCASSDPLQAVAHVYQGVDN
jgi:hypothetical protein